MTEQRMAPEAWVSLPGEDQVRRFVPSGHPYDFGFITGMQRLIMAHMGIAPFFGALFRQIMFEPGALTRAEREMVAAVASAAQDCHY